MVLVLKLQKLEIGEMVKLLPELKTKVHAVHVGHSQPQELLKVLQLLLDKNLFPFQNNNQLTVQLHMETKDVKEV